MRGTANGRNAPAELRFGGCLVRRWSREILLDGVLQDVERRTFDLIDYLIANRDRVVTKDELLDSVWRNRCLSESVISQAVMKARRALGDDARRPALIRTVHGVGYLFTGELLAHGPEPERRDAA